MEKPPFLRRRFIVDWKLQGSLCAHGLIYGGLVLAMVSGGIFVPLLWTLGDDVNLPTIEEEAIVMLYMHERFWVLALLCAFVVVLGAIRFSHRIAGPLVRYKRNLRMLAEGKLAPPLRTRRGDYLKEEVVCLNAAVAGVSERVEAIRKAQLAVRREVLAVLQHVPRPAQTQFEPLLAANRELENAIASFHESDPGDDRVPEAAGEPAVAMAGAGGQEA